MKRTFQSTITAILLSSVALVPAATITVVATADTAYAKSENGQGNGNSEDRGDRGNSGNNGGNKGGNSSEAHSSSSSSSSSRGKSGGLSGFISKLTGQEKKAARTTQAPKAMQVAKKADPMHPSNLGNMNGAMNANINAVLAHIKNGNTNGPVGLLAGLAVANVNAEGAQEIIDLAEDFDDLQTALDASPYSSVEEYFAALDGVEGIEPIQAIEDAIANDDADELAAALDAAGYADLEAYQDAVAGEEGAEEIAELSDAIEVLGGNVEERTGITAVEPTDEEVEQAEADIEAQNNAEQAILDSWNKNPDGTEEISAEEQALLDKLNERLAAEEAAIRDAMGIEEDPAATCEAEEGCETPEEVATVAE